MTFRKENPMPTKYFDLELPPLPYDAVVALYETLQEVLLALEHTYPHALREYYRLNAPPTPPQRDLFHDDALDMDPF